MTDARDKMITIENEINDFLNRYPKVTPASFPFKEYKSLNKKLSDTHIEIAAENSGIHLKEGIKWFHDQIRKLTNFIP